MGKKPEIIYTDDEGALHKPSIQTYFKETNIEHNNIIILFYLFLLEYIKQLYS
jgi:hypothetical protein